MIVLWKLVLLTIYTTYCGSNFSPFPFVFLSTCVHCAYLNTITPWIMCVFLITLCISCFLCLYVFVCAELTSMPKYVHCTLYLHCMYPSRHTLHHLFSTLLAPGRDCLECPALRILLLLVLGVLVLLLVVVLFLLLGDGGDLLGDHLFPTLLPAEIARNVQLLDSDLSPK